MTSLTAEETFEKESPTRDSSVPLRRSSSRVKNYRGPDLRLPRPDWAPDPDDTGEVRRWVSDQDASGLTAIDLFCGAGGLSLGLHRAGFRVLVGADSDPRSVETHVANLGGLGYLGDLGDPQALIGQLKAWGIGTVDLVAGGVPCQPFSRAGQSKLRDLVSSGKRSADDPRTTMWRSFITIVRALRPRAVLLENVPDLATWDEGAVLVGFRESLRALGYRTTTTILRAFEHGVPQHRNRLFIVAMRPGSMTWFDWPDPEPDAPALRDAIGDLPRVDAAQRVDRLDYGGPRSELQRKMREGVDHDEAGLIYDHITRDIRADDAEAFELLPQGGTYSQLPPRLQRYRTDIFSDKYKRLEWDGLSRSITAHLAKDGYWYIHPDQTRTLSVREAARIQTFPDWFRFAGTPTTRYRQIGNAVPVLLAEALADSVHEALSLPPRRGRPPSDGEEFHTAISEWHVDHRRDHAWRQDPSPWRVLVAEVCFRRSSTSQAQALFEELIRLAPDATGMIERAEDVHVAMGRMGLETKTEMMLSIARELVDRFDGSVPRETHLLRSLPGVGDYVANAVAAFGFGAKTVLLDANTIRIVDRFRGRATKSNRWRARLDLYELAGPEGPDPEFNYSLSDLGALVCTPSEPDCESCPVKSQCRAFRGQNLG